MADDLTGTDQKIPDNSRRRLTLQVSQVSHPGSVHSDSIFGLWFNKFLDLISTMCRGDSSV